jgi:hypothetical protein
MVGGGGSSSSMPRKSSTTPTAAAAVKTMMTGSSQDLHAVGRIVVRALHSDAYLRPAADALVHDWCMRGHVLFEQHDSASAWDDERVRHLSDVDALRAELEKDADTVYTVLCLFRVGPPHFRSVLRMLLSTDPEVREQVLTTIDLDEVCPIDED